MTKYIIILIVISLLITVRIMAKVTKEDIPYINIEELKGEYIDVIAYSKNYRHTVNVYTEKSEYITESGYEYDCAELRQKGERLYFANIPQILILLKLAGYEFVALDTIKKETHLICKRIKR